MNYFGTDGIRGIPNQKLTIELMVKIGQALSIFHNKNVCIATDTRRSKDMLISGIAGGAMSRGLNVYYLGILPTPALIDYALVHQMTGIMITASHNAYEDNGIKILNRGKKLSLEEEGLLEIEIDKKSNASEEVGIFSVEDGEDSYSKRILSLFQPSHFKVAIDCANGATYQLAPTLLNVLTAELITVAAEPDGKNINKNCGSTHLELLKETVLKYRCDLGFAFDGDGDRVLCIRSDGKLVTGDELIYIIACYLKAKNKLYQNKVVLSKMSNLGVLLALDRKGIGVIQTEVGDKYISMSIQEHDASIGGENSGHIIVPHLFSSGDGILIACYILQILEETKTKIEDWLSDVYLFPEKTLNLKVYHKEQVITNKRFKDYINELKQGLLPNGKIIARVSGTEDVVRLTVMNDQEEQVNQVLSCLSNKIREIDYE